MVNVARTSNRLTALKVEKSRQPGMYADGGGLYLRVTPEGTKNWVFRFMLKGKARWMGIGPVALFGLHEARAKALDARRLHHQGRDPIETRNAVRAQERLDAAKAMTFSNCASAYIRAHRAGWRNAKHAAQWETTLATYAEPIIGALSVQTVDTALIMKALEQEVCDTLGNAAKPLWTARPETASRLRGRIEAILDWAKVRGYRDGENPARWRGHLDKLLPARTKVRKVEHHAALPYAEIPAFMAKLREQDGVSARALEFAILTAARTGEVLGATWDEINWTDKAWTIGGARMKAGNEHRVPLCTGALTVLQKLEPTTEELRSESNRGNPDEQFVFAGGKAGRPLSNMAFLMLLRRMGRGDLTAHGFRSTFRDWAAERTHFPSEVVEMALAHAVGNKVEAAYRRGDLFEKRRKLMEAWASYCLTPNTGKVIALRR
jgi:integrase